ncbi:protein YbiO [Enterobacter cloacae]|uniref:Protein YbiO n=1 Tax=Enterobacter cloacae TaxID=550 RepID=A0A377M5E5_ENTCL|nr:protein YbiO [Enterobacter cloacae]
MPWILLLLLSLFSAPSIAVAIPGVTTGTSTAQQKTPPPEPDAEEKKAAYSALADVLENDTSRQELVDQLRKIAATPPQEPVPTITPPPVEEQKTVLENVTEVSRHYADALSSRFAQLYRNLMGSSHKPFNPRTFTAAATQFYCWRPPSSFFTGWCACVRGPCTEKWGNGVARRISRKAAGCICR